MNLYLSQTSLGLNELINYCEFLYRDISESEALVRRHLKINNNRSMMKVFGDPKAFPGMVAVLKADLEAKIRKTKFPYMVLRDHIFAHSYITTHALSDSVRGGCKVSYYISCDPN